jgi:hypothetical protein
VTFEATATDNCSAAEVTCAAAGQTLASGATFPVGTTSVTCEAADGDGNLASGSFSVTVTGDPTGPVIQCNAPDVVSGAVTITATASDDCADIVSIEVTKYRCASTGHADHDKDSHRPCPVSSDGATLIIGNGGCSSDSIEWTVRAVDAAGNETTQECRVAVDGEERGHSGRERSGHGGHGHGGHPPHRR